MFKDTAKKVIYNVIVALVISLVFIAVEQFFRSYSEGLDLNFKLKLIAEYTIINFLIISLKSKKAIKIVYLILTSIIVFQYVHYNFYGSWIFPLEYILFFTQFSEVLNTFSSIYSIAFLPLILGTILFTSSFFIVSKMKDDRLVIPYLKFIWIAYLIYMPINIWIKDSKRGARPDMERNTIRNTLWTLSYLSGSLIPKKVFGDSSFEQNLVATPSIIKKNPNINIIMIMGESLSSDAMSLYGYEKVTTPYLDSLKSSENFVYKQGISAGVMTDVSIPSFFNMVYKPDSMPQIVSTNTCLFKMASNNGFNTYFYSAQARSEISGIKSYLCTRWIDELKDGTDITGEDKVSALDKKLLPYLENIDFTKSNFLVLHQRGSHGPIEKRYTEAFNVFKTNPENKSWENFLQQYQNSILYTDDFLKNVIETVKEKSVGPTYIVFTSDHGESFGPPKEGGGHGNLDHEKQYKVPFFVYALKDDKVKNVFNKADYVSHYEMGKYLTSLMGYEMKNICYQDDGYYVCGPDIHGYAGFLKLEIEDKKLKKTMLNR